MNCKRMSQSFAPMAMRIPILRVRSVTDTSMMFMMPIPPTRRETDAMAPRRRVSPDTGFSPRPFLSFFFKYNQTCFRFFAGQRQVSLLRLPERRKASPLVNSPEAWGSSSLNSLGSPKTDKGIEKGWRPIIRDASLVFAQLMDFVPSFHFHQNLYLFSEFLLSVACSML